MAEIVGLVASGISIATLVAQLGKSLVKLKDCWDQIQDAPFSIRVQLLQLDQLYKTLEAIKSSQPENGTQSLPPDMLNFCQGAADELRNLADELSKRIKGKTGLKKKIDSIRIVIKKDEAKKLKERLTDAIQLLQLALQGQTYLVLQRQGNLLEFTHTLVQQQHSVITANSQHNLISDDTSMTTNTTQTTKTTTTMTVATRRNFGPGFLQSPLQYLLGGFQYQCRNERHKGKERVVHKTLLRPPAWLSLKVWDTTSFQARTGWQHTLSSYRVLPYSHPVFEATRDGDIDELKYLFSTQEGFLTDRDTHGLTLLHHAADNRSVELVEFLLALGADPTIETNCGEFALDSVIRKTQLDYNTNSDVTRLKVTRLLISWGCSDLFIQDISRVYGGIESPDLLKYLRDQVYPDYFSFSEAQRFEGFGWIRYLPSPTHFAILMGDDYLEKKASTLIQDDWGYNILHSCAWDTVENWYLPREKLASWREVRRKAMHFRDCISVCDDMGLTPLYTMVDGLLRKPTLACSDLHEQLVLWLEDLAMCGIDLEHYGETENQLRLNAKSPRYLRRYYDGRFDWVGLTYGAHSEDWRVWVSEPTDICAGEFWRMAEGNQRREEMKRECTMPGSWQEWEMCEHKLDICWESDDVFDLYYDGFDNW